MDEGEFSKVKQKEDELALAIHLANANEVPLSVQVIERLAIFIAEDVGGHGAPFQAWVEEISMQRRQIQEEDKLLRSQKLTMERRVNRLEEHLEGQLSRLQEETVKATSIINQLEERIVSLKLQLEASSVREKDLSSRLVFGQEKSDALSKKLEGAEEQLRIERERLESAVESLHLVEEQLCNERSARVQALADCNVSEELAAQLLVEQEVSQRLRESVQALQQTKEEAMHQSNNLKAQTEELMSSNRKLEEQLEARKLLVLRLQDDIEKSNGKIKMKEREHDEYKNSLTRRMGQVQEHLQRLRDERAEMLSARPLLESQISQLETTIENLERGHERTLCELAQEHSKEIDDIHQEHQREISQLVMRLHEFEAMKDQGIGIQKVRSDYNCRMESRDDDAATFSLVLRGRAVAQNEYGTDGTDGFQVLEEIKQDLVRAAAVEEWRVDARYICTLVDVIIQPGQDHAAKSDSVARELVAQASDPCSTLLRGRQTCTCLQAWANSPARERPLSEQASVQPHQQLEDEIRAALERNAELERQVTNLKDKLRESEIATSGAERHHQGSRMAQRGGRRDRSLERHTHLLARACQVGVGTVGGGAGRGINQGEVLAQLAQLRDEVEASKKLCTHLRARNMQHLGHLERTRQRLEASERLNTQLDNELTFLRSTAGLSRANDQDQLSGADDIVSPCSSGVLTQDASDAALSSPPPVINQPSPPSIPILEAAEQAVHERPTQSGPNQGLLKEHKRMRKLIHDLLSAKEKSAQQQQINLSERQNLFLKIDKLTKEKSHLHHKLLESHALAALQQQELRCIQDKLESLSNSSATVESKLIETVLAASQQQTLQANLSSLREQNLVLVEQIRRAQEMLLSERNRAASLEFEISHMRSSRQVVLQGIEDAKLLLDQMDSISPDIELASRQILKDSWRLLAEIAQWRTQAEMSEKELACKKSEIFTIVERTVAYLTDNKCEVPLWLQTFRESELIEATPVLSRNGRHKTAAQFAQALPKVLEIRRKPQVDCNDALSPCTSDHLESTSAIEALRWSVKIRITDIHNVPAYHQGNSLPFSCNCALLETSDRSLMSAVATSDFAMQAISLWQATCTFSLTAESCLDLNRTTSGKLVPDCVKQQRLGTCLGPGSWEAYREDGAALSLDRDNEITISSFWAVGCKSMSPLDGRPVLLLLQLDCANHLELGNALVPVFPGAPVTTWAMLSTNVVKDDCVDSPPPMMQLRVAYSRVDGDAPDTSSCAVSPVVGSVNLWKWFLVEHSKSSPYREQLEAKAKKRLERKLLQEACAEDIVLPSGWRAQKSRKSGKIFFRNKDTGELTWRAPKGSWLKSATSDYQANTTSSPREFHKTWTLQVTFVKGFEVGTCLPQATQLFCCVTALRAGPSNSVGSSANIVVLQHFVGDDPVIPGWLTPQHRTQAVSHQQDVEWNDATVITQSQSLEGGQGMEQGSQHKPGERTALDGRPVLLLVTVHTWDGDRQSQTIGRVFVPVRAGPVSQVCVLMLNGHGLPVVGTTGRPCILSLRVAYGQPHTQAWPRGHPPCVVTPWAAGVNVLNDVKPRPFDAASDDPVSAQ